MISGRSCQKNKVRSCGANDETDDGGSAYAASSADALSSDISSFSQAGRNRLLRFPAIASRHWKMAGRCYRCYTTRILPIHRQPPAAHVVRAAACERGYAYIL